MLEKEKLESLLKEKEALLNRTVIAYNQLLGQISILKQLLDKNDPEETKAP